MNRTFLLILIPLGKQTCNVHVRKKFFQLQAVTGNNLPCTILRELENSDGDRQIPHPTLSRADFLQHHLDCYAKYPGAARISEIVCLLFLSPVCPARSRQPLAQFARTKPPVLRLDLGSLWGAGLGRLTVVHSLAPFSLTCSPLCPVPTYLGVPFFIVSLSTFCL